MSEAEVRRLRATTVSMVYQNPAAALNPSIRVGDQVAEVFELLGHDRGEALERAREMLRKVQISDPRRVMRRYPHQLSGGDAAAGRDRDGAGQGPDAAHPRRADDRPRRDGRGRGARPHRRAARRSSARASSSSATTSPSSARCASGSASSTPAGSSRRAPRRRSSPTRAIRTPSACCAASRAAGCARTATALDTIPGYLPQLGARSAGLRLRRPLRPRRGDLPHGRAAAPPARRRALEPLPLPRPGGRGPVHRRPIAAGRHGGRGTATRPRPARGTPARHSRRRGRTCARSSTSTSRSRRERRSGSSASPASGKTTLARVLLGLTAPDRGSAVELDGERARAAGRRSGRRSRCARSRSSSRTRTRRSTGASRCAGSSAGR